MKIIKNFIAGITAIAAMGIISVAASAEHWTINYTHGAPSHLSNDHIYRTYSSNNS